MAANKDARPVILVGNYYEGIGIFVKYGLVGENTACEMCSQRGLPFGWHNSEYMYTLWEAWFQRYPEGKFPSNRRRAIPDSSSAETI